MVLPTTLCLAAAAALINIWLMTRIGKARQVAGISVGDGGNEALIRRMRAQANFIENTPLALILIAAVEISGKGGDWLIVSGAIFMVGRIAHAVGMDGNFKAGRPIGTLTAMLFLLGLAVAAVLIALGRI